MQVYKLTKPTKVLIALCAQAYELGYLAHESFA